MKVSGLPYVTEELELVTLLIAVGVATRAVTSRSTRSSPWILTL